MDTKSMRARAVATSLVVLSLLSACTQADDPRTGTGPSTPLPDPGAAARSRAALAHNHPSPQSIAVAWDTPATRDAAPTVLTGTVRNSTSLPKEVELRVAGIDPHGAEVIRPLATVTVPAKSTTPFTVAVADLPVQSAGIDSKVTVLARYPLSAPLPNGETRTIVHEVQSVALHVTFDDNMARATILDTAAQARANGLRFRTTAPQVTRLRHYQPGLGGMEERRSALTAGQPDLRPVMTVSDVGPDIATDSEEVTP